LGENIEIIEPVGKNIVGQKHRETGFPMIGKVSNDWKNGKEGGCEART
jgi:hypothetical protein